MPHTQKLPVCPCGKITVGEKLVGQNSASRSEGMGGEEGTERAGKLDLLNHCSGLQVSANGQCF